MTPRPRTPKTRRGPATSLPPELARLFEQQIARFREKFGREPGPHDPIFFDPEAPEPRPLDPERFMAIVTEAMERAGIDPALIHAFRRTGRILSAQAARALSKKELAAWRAAIKAYRALQRERP